MYNSQSHLTAQLFTSHSLVSQYICVVQLTAISKYTCVHFTETSQSTPVYTSQPYLSLHMCTTHSHISQHNFVHLTVPSHSTSMCSTTHSHLKVLLCTPYSLSHIAPVYNSFKSHSTTLYNSQYICVHLTVTSLSTPVYISQSYHCTPSRTVFIVCYLTLDKFNKDDFDIETMHWSIDSLKLSNIGLYTLHTFT